MSFKSTLNEKHDILVLRAIVSDSHYEQVFLLLYLNIHKFVDSKISDHAVYAFFKAYKLEFEKIT